MKWRARVLLVVALLAAPAYALLDAAGLVPVSIRDRPWPFALLIVLACAPAWRRASRAAALLVAGAALLALGWTAHARYRLPPASDAGLLDAPLPDVTLKDESGNPVRLRELRDRPTLFIWFRGSWCPYCRRQLADLAAELRQHAYADVRLLALAPDPPPPLQKLKRDLKLPFTLLSDPELLVANQCRLAHCVAILDGKGMVRWEVVSGNWEKDLPARALLQAAYRQK